MATARTGGNDLTTLGRKSFKSIIALLGRKDITLTTFTITLNQSGRLKTRTSATSTITGDLQFVTVKDKQWIDLGYAKVGDGILYAPYNITIVAEDHATVDSVNWEFSKQIEGETINGNLVYQAWIMKRIEEG